MRQTVNFGQLYSFGNVEFLNVRLIDSGIHAVLERLQTPENFIVMSHSGRSLLHIGGGLSLVCYDDTSRSAPAKTDFPQETKILEDGSILPRYFGEFEKDGIHYIIIDCDEQLAPKEDRTNWIRGTYRNMIYDLRSPSEQISYEVKHTVNSTF